jgi:hypothetical protein
MNLLVEQAVLSRYGGLDTCTCMQVQVYAPRQTLRFMKASLLRMRPVGNPPSPGESR